MVDHSQVMVLLEVWCYFPWALLVVVVEEWAVMMVERAAIEVQDRGRYCCRQQVSDWETEV